MPPILEVPGAEPPAEVENAEGGARNLNPDPFNNVIVLEEGTSALDFLKGKAHERSEMDDQNAFYVADLGDVVEKYNRFHRELPRVKPFYAVKCNDSKEVLQLLAVLGAGFNCVSKDEMDLVLSLGITADNIFYGNTCKQPSFIRHAGRHGITKMTFDCESEVFKIAEEYPDTEMILRIVASDSGSTTVPSKKFGAPIQNCEGLLKLAKIMKLTVTGVSFHVGTLSKRPQAFRQAIIDARYIFDIARDIGHEMTLLDIGGGFHGDSIIPVFEEFTPTINEAINEYFPDTEVKIIATPGRYFVASAFTAAVNVIGKKDMSSAGIEGKRLSYFLNDGIFGTFWPFEQKNVKLKLLKDYPLSQRRCSSTLWGPCCTDADLILEEVTLPELDIKDWIMFLHMGAYSLSKTSTFHGFLPPTVFYTMSEDHFNRIQGMQALARQ